MAPRLSAELRCTAAPPTCLLQEQGERLDAHARQVAAAEATAHKAEATAHKAEATALKLAERSVRKRSEAGGWWVVQGRAAT